MKKKQWERKSKSESMLVSHGEVRRVLLAKREPLFIVPSYMLLHVFFPFVTTMLISKNEMFKEFQDIFPKDVPHELSSLKGTEHHMDLTLGTILPNREAYKMNHREVRENMRSCAMPVILMPKMDNYLLTPYKFHLSCKPSFYV
ncbi:hypothetical protein CR513_60319, partial [Mucuna pruriens]